MLILHSFCLSSISATFYFFISFSFFWLASCLSSMNLSTFLFEFFWLWMYCNVFFIWEIILCFVSVSFLRFITFFFSTSLSTCFFPTLFLKFEFLIKGAFLLPASYLSIFNSGLCVNCFLVCSMWGNSLQLMCVILFLNFLQQLHKYFTFLFFTFML